MVDSDKEESVSSSSSKTSEKSPSPQVSKSPSSESIRPPSPPSPVEERATSPIPSPPAQEPIKSSSPPSPPTTPTDEPKEILPPSTVSHDYDEDFSETSRSPVNTPTKKPVIDELDIESIHEELEDKPSVRDTNHSSTSKSSADEQSAILVLGKSSATNTPRQQEEKTLEEDIPPVSIPVPTKIESDDTSHDVSEEDEQGTKIDRLTETLIRTFIDEAIDQSKEIETTKLKTPVTKEASEWMSDEDLTDEDTNKQTPTGMDEDVE